MRISLGLVTAMPVEESISLGGMAEKLGYHRIFVGEDIFHRELFTYLSIIALNTKNIGLASGITSPYVRNGWIIASSSKALSELSGGRFTLGLGTGGLPEVERLTGERPKKPLDILEKTVSFLRKKLGLEIYLGVRGPRMLELAGRIADGVIISGPRSYLDRAVEIIDNSSRGRRVKKVLWNAFHLGEDPGLISKITSVMLESMPAFALENIDKTRANEELCIYGSKEKILEEISNFEKKGIDEFVIGPPYGKDPLAVVKEMGG